jgi:hypothetical protein
MICEENFRSRLIRDVPYVAVAVLCMFLALCSSSLKASLLNINSDKEDFPESTIEDIKGWCNKNLILQQTHLIIFKISIV